MGARSCMWLGAAWMLVVGASSGTALAQDAGPAAPRPPLSNTDDAHQGYVVARAISEPADDVPFNAWLGSICVEEWPSAKRTPSWSTAAQPRPELARPWLDHHTSGADGTTWPGECALASARRVLRGASLLWRPSCAHGSGSSSSPFSSLRLFRCPPGLAVGSSAPRRRSSRPVRRSCTRSRTMARSP